MSKPKLVPTVLAIGGYDSLSGGGIGTDLQVFSHFQTQGYAAVTSLVRVFSNEVKIFQIPDEILESQLQSIIQNQIIDAIKIGLIISPSQFEIIKQFVSNLETKPKIVVDPVMSLKEDANFISGTKTHKSPSWYFELSKFADLITPNFEESEILEDFLAQNNLLLKTPKLVKKAPIDTLYYNNQTKSKTFQSEFNETKNINGAGCAHSSAIAANLALGKPLETAISTAKIFVTKAIADGQNGSVWIGK